MCYLLSSPLTLLDLGHMQTLPLGMQADWMAGESRGRLQKGNGEKKGGKQEHFCAHCSLSISRLPSLLSPALSETQYGK